MVLYKSVPPGLQRQQCEATELPLECPQILLVDEVITMTDEVNNAWQKKNVLSYWLGAAYGEEPEPPMYIVAQETDAVA